MQKVNLVLLGHTGFIGKEIFSQLRVKKITVRGFSSKEINLFSPSSVRLLQNLLNKETILIVASAITRELGDNISSMQKNIQIISNIALAIEKSPIKKCVYLSTADVYGKPNGPISEKLPLNPQTYYALAKICSEKILEITLNKTQTPLLIFRYNGVFGPGQKNIGYGPNYFIHSILNEGSVKIWGDGKEMRDSLYVKDLAKIIISLSLSNTSGIYNIATGKSRAFVDILKIIRKVSSIKFTIQERDRTSSSFNQIFDTSKLKKALPAVTFTPLEKVIEETCKQIIKSI